MKRKQRTERAALVLYQGVESQAEEDVLVRAWRLQEQRRQLLCTPVYLVDELLVFLSRDAEVSASTHALAELRHMSVELG